MMIKFNKYLVVFVGSVFVNGLSGASEHTEAPNAALEGSKIILSDNFAELKNPEWIKEGRQKFIQTCAYCHGTRGEAGKTKPFTSRKDWNPQVIHDTIVKGRVNGPNVMPSWEGSIPDDTIWKIVSYIKSLNLDFEQRKQ